jgi:hypothetical protein
LEVIIAGPMSASNINILLKRNMTTYIIEVFWYQFKITKNP